MRRASDAAINVMCEWVKPRGGTQAPKGFPLQEEKEEEMRTKKIAMIVAMAAVVLVALVGSGRPWPKRSSGE
jgi:hypothetical protein